MVALRYLLNGHGYEADVQMVDAQL
jgi:hypothetical protein